MGEARAPAGPSRRRRAPGRRRGQARLLSPLRRDLILQHQRGELEVHEVSWQLQQVTCLYVPALLLEDRKSG
jgi:hypothetical protein